jgi:hypothetical protein
MSIAPSPISRAPLTSSSATPSSRSPTKTSSGTTTIAVFSVFSRTMSSLFSATLSSALLTSCTIGITEMSGSLTTRIAVRTSSLSVLVPMPCLTWLVSAALTLPLLLELLHPPRLLLSLLPSLFLLPRLPFPSLLLVTPTLPSHPPSLDQPLLADLATLMFSLLLPLPLQPSLPPSQPARSTRSLPALPASPIVLSAMSPPRSSPLSQHTAPAPTLHPLLLNLPRLPSSQPSHQHACTPSHPAPAPAPATRATSPPRSFTTRRSSTPSNRLACTPSPKPSSAALETLAARRLPPRDTAPSPSHRSSRLPSLLLFLATALPADLLVPTITTTVLSQVTTPSLAMSNPPRATLHRITPSLRVAPPSQLATLLRSFTPTSPLMSTRNPPTPSQPSSSQQVHPSTQHPLSQQAPAPRSSTARAHGMFQLLRHSSSVLLLLLCKRK